MSMLSLGKDKQWIDSPSEMDMENMHVSQIPEYELNVREDSGNVLINIFILNRCHVL